VAQIVFRHATGFNDVASGFAIPCPQFPGYGAVSFDVPDDRIMVVSYSIKGDSFVVEKPRVWTGQSVALTMGGAVGAQYDVAPDGKRIAVGTYAGGSTQQGAGHVIFLDNFVGELQRKCH
jgi:hypothetical protein